MDILLAESNMHMSRHEYYASHVSESLTSAFTSSKPRRVISSEHCSLFKYTTKKIDVEIGNIIFDNGLTFRTLDLREMDDIILNSKKVPR